MTRLWRNIPRLSPSGWALGFILFLALFIWRCQEKGSFNPTGPSLRLVFIGNLSANPSTLRAGGSRSLISGKVVDQQGLPYEGVLVGFRASRGQIEERDTTNRNGEFSVQYLSGDSPGIDTVIVTALDAQARLTLEILPPLADITLQVGRATLRANGEDTTLVMAQITSSQGNIERVPVLFSVDWGTINGDTVLTLYTDTEGKIRARYTAPPLKSGAIATITARILETSQRTMSPSTSSLSQRGGSGRTSLRAMGHPKEHRILGNLTGPGEGSRIQASEGMEARLTIRLRGIQLTVTSAVQLIPGDGVSSTAITARLREEEGTPIAGAQVRFSAYRGTIPFSATTDPTGTAQVSYTAPRQERGQDTIVARYGSELTDTLIIRFANPIARMTLQSSSSSLLGNGKAFVDLTATVTGETGRPAPGVEVRFDADDGYLQPAGVITDSSGRANSRYFSFFTSQDETVAVRAWVVSSSLTSPGRSGEEIESSLFTRKINLPLQMSELANSLPGEDEVPGSYPSEGFSAGKGTGRWAKEKSRTMRSLSPAQSEIGDTLILVVRGVGIASRLGSEVVVGRAGASVQVIARLFESRTRRPIPNDTVYFETDWGTIPPWAITDSEGSASVVWRLSESRTGEVNISVSYGTLRESHILTLVSPVGSLSLDTDRSALLAGGLRSALIRAVVRDFQNSPSPLIPVLFLVGIPPSDSLIVLTDSTGTASISVQSFPTETDSSLWVKAQVESFADSLRLDIRAVRRRLTVTPDTLSAGGSSTATITFTAYEQLTQQPVVGDTVRFSAIGGQVDSWGVLDPTGRVRVTFRPGQEVGIASVVARLGSLTPVSTDIVLVEPLHHLTLFTARPSLLGNGLDTTTLIITAFNIVGQPTPGARVALLPSMGRVEPQEVSTDASGRAQALYTGGASPTDTVIYLYAFASMPPQTSPQPEALPDARLTLPLPRNKGVSSSPEPTRLPPREVERGELSSYQPSILLNPIAQFSAMRVKEDAEIRDSLAIRLRGVSLNLRIAPRQIRADGRSKAGVWVQLRERTSGVAIPGARIGLGATLGSIAAEGVTRADGTFTDSLTAGLESGECRVIAFYGNRLEAQDTLFFTPDPDRVNLSFDVEPDTVVVGGGVELQLRAVVTDGFGNPLERMAIGFAVLSPRTILQDTAEYREVSRWENAFEIEELEGVQGLRLAFQLRGVDHPETRLLVNRRDVAGLALPRSPLWGDYTMIVPPQALQSGVNRMEIVGGGEGESRDRFSLAGVRLALMKETLLAYRVTDRSGRAEVIWGGDPSSGRAELKAYLVDQPARSSLKRVVVMPGAPGRILISPGQDTIVAFGEGGAVPIGLMVTDRMGNPVRGGYRIRLEATGGAQINPPQVITLSDGTASATLHPPLAFSDTTVDLRAQFGEVENLWRLRLLGIRADLVSDRGRALADGSSQVVIRGSLHTTQGTPLGGRRVQFTTTRGNITPTGVTDQRGEVQAVLTAPRETGAALVRMWLGQQVLDSLTVVFVSPVGDIRLSAQPQTLRGDGLDSTILTVTVLNGLDEPAERVRVSLSVSSGILRSRTLVTNAQGQASTTLFAPPTPQDFAITAIAALENEQRDTLIIPVRGITLTASLSRDSLPANGVATAEVNVQVRETSSGDPVPRGTIYFSATAGSITATAELDRSGRARAVYTAGEEPATIFIRARWAERIEDTVSVILVEPVASLTAQARPSSILANGQDEAQLTVRLFDLWGEPVPNQLVRLEFDGPGRGEPTVGRSDEQGIFLARMVGNPSVSDGVVRAIASLPQRQMSREVRIFTRGVTLNLSADVLIIPGDGRSTLNLTASAFETSSGNPVVGDTVRFTTTGGVIQPYGVLNRDGLAQVTLRSPPNAGLAQVVARYGADSGITDTLTVAFAQRFSYLNLSVEPNSLLADGEDSARVVITLQDTLGNAVSGVWVNLITAPERQVSSDSVRTDNSGRATAYVYSFAAVRDTSLALTVRVGHLVRNIAVPLRGVRFSLSTDPDTLPANGRSRATITASLSETTSGNPVVGRVVRFSTNLGVVGSQAISDSIGSARTSLIAANQEGTARIQAFFGRTLTVSREVVFVAPVGSLTLSVQPRQILADALDSAIVVAQMRDQRENPAPGVRVFFSAPQGGRVFPNSGVSDEEGIVRTVYRGMVLERDSVVSVEASAEGGATGSVNITLQGVSLQVTAYPDEISGNGYATSLISALLTRTTDNVPLVRREIRFRSSAGLIGERAETDTLGRAQVRLISPPREASVAVVAQYSDFRDTVIVRCLQSLPAGGEIAIDPSRISIAGVGRAETARLTLTVRDARGEPVPDQTAIQLVEATRLGIRFPQNADTASLVTSNGQASVTIRSGYRTGVARFRALYSGQVLAEGGELVVEAGLPQRVQVFVDVNAPRSLAGGFTALPVSAAVQDTFGNPVADSTRVTFSLVPDTLGQITSTGYTRNGMVLTEPEAYPAGIWLTFPQRFAGERIRVRAFSGNAADSTSIVLPGALQGGDPAEIDVEADSSRLVADGVSTTAIRARIYDADGRPVRDMTEVRFGARLGRVTSPRWTAGGMVETTYRAGQVIGVDTITVSAGEVRGSVVIGLRPGTTHRLVLTALRDTLRANGIDQTTLIAQLYDRYDNPADAGRSVEFSASLGEITSPVLTDSVGRAVARLTSAVETGISLVTARSGEGFAQRRILLVSGSADNIVLLSVDRTGIGIRGSGSPETANLIFEVRDDRGVPVDSLHATRVAFILDGPAQVVDEDVAGEDSVAFLEPDTTLTDAQGRAAVTLRSGYYAGAVQVTAEIPGVARGRAISVTIFGGPPDIHHFTVLPSRCLLTGLEGTGPDTSNIIVTLGDRFSNPVTPGTIVYFSASGGVIEGSARTDSLGQAMVRLITTQPFPVEGVDTVFAQTVDWQNRSLTAQTRVLVTGRTRVRIEPAEDWSIPFGGYQDFVITVADTFEHSLVQGTSIQVTATAYDRTGAEVTGLRLTGDGVDEPIVIEECSPRTRFSVRLFSFIPGLASSQVELKVSVTSRNGDEEMIARGVALPQVLSVEFSRVRVNPSQLLADGSTEATVQIVLLDTLRVPIANVDPEMVEVFVEGGEVEVTPPQAPSDERGNMVATLVARSPGEGIVKVRVEGRELVEQPRIVFIPGPPASITVLVERRRLVVGGGDSTAVVVTVFDDFGNRVRDGVSITFSAPDGTFDPSFTATQNGVARTIFYSGTTAGTTSFTVTALEGGVSVEETVEDMVFLPGPPAQITVTAENYLVEVASQNGVVVSVADRFGNSVGLGVLIALSVSPAGQGSVVPDTIFTDSTGTARASFIAGREAGQMARVVAVSGDAQGRSALFTFLPAPPGRVEITADPQQQVVGRDVRVTAQVTDAYGNPVSDTTIVFFSSDPVRGSFNPRSVRTSRGEARSTLQGVTVAGQVVVIATAGEVEGSTVVTFTPGEVSQLTLEASPTDLTFGRTASLTATATDRYDNTVPGAELQFAIIQDPGGSRLMFNQRVTNQRGQAVNAFTAGNSSGTAIIAVIYNPDGGDPEAEALVFINITAP